MSSISVSELKDEKRALDKRIAEFLADAVSDFYQATGVSISSVDVHMVQHSTMEGHQWIIGGVKTDLHLW